MSFFDDLGAATYATKTTTVGAGQISTWHSKQLLERITQLLQMYKFADLAPLPEGNGTTAEWTRTRPLAVATSALSEGVNPNATQVYFQKIKATLAEYGAFGQVTSLVSQSHISRPILDAVETFAEQAAETMNLLVQMEVGSNGGYPLRADLDSTKEYTGTLTTVTSTTSMADTALASNTDYGDANDDCNQSVMTMTSGPAKGESRTITDYATSGGVITLTRGFDMTPEVGDSYRIVTPDALAAGDDLSYTNLKKARALLANEKAKTFGKYYACVLDSLQYHNLMDDTVWKGVMTNKERTRGIEDEAVAGPFAGFMFYEHTQPFAFPIATIGTAGASYGPGNNGGNYSASADIKAAFCFGKRAFGATSFKKKGKQLMKPPVIVKYPDNSTTSDPLNRIKATVGWVIEAAMKSKWSLWCMPIWTYKE